MCAKLKMLSLNSYNIYIYVYIDFCIHNIQCIYMYILYYIELQKRY